jgi:segregation and condensation protein B
MDDLKAIIESLLFVADAPLPLDRLKTILPQATGAQIREAIEELEAEYEARRGGFHLRMVAGGWQLRSRPEYTDWIRTLIKPSPLRLSKAALETLAIVAYNQPIIRSDIEHFRGVDCGGTLRMLMERKLIRVLGRKEIPGRPLIYATTRYFLELFNLKDLKDLPTPREIEANTAHTPGLELPTGLTAEVVEADAPANGLPEEGPTPAAADAEDRQTAAGAPPSAGQAGNAAPFPEQPRTPVKTDEPFPEGDSRRCP